MNSIVATKKPIKPPIKFLTGDLELIDANMDNPKIASAKYSGGPNLYNSKVGAKIIKTIRESIPQHSIQLPF